MKRILSILLLGWLFAAPAFAYQAYTPAGIVDVGVTTHEAFKSTYSVTITGITPVATATDVLVVTGSATKTVRITRVEISTAATAAGSINLYLYKRTAVNTGGTAAAQSIVLHDSADTAATAAANLYSVNATGLGTGIAVRTARYSFPAVATSTFAVIPWVQQFGVTSDKTVVLRGVAQSLAVGFAGQVIPAGMVLNVAVEWTEE